MNEEPRQPPPAPADRPAVETRGVGRLFGPVRALADVTLQLVAGEACLLLGPNGAGKSTLLRILATLLRPSAGEVRYDGRTAAEAGPQLRARIAYLSHRTQLHGDLTGREALALAADLRGVARAATERWATRTGMTTFQDRPVRTYSRGQTQRVALARTFVGSPSLVLLDEPATGLDPEAVGVLRDILREQVAAGTTLVVATHDPDPFAAVAARTIRLAAGRIAADSRSAPGAA